MKIIMQVNIKILSMHKYLKKFSTFWTSKSRVADRIQVYKISLIISNLS